MVQSWGNLTTSLDHIRQQQYGTTSHVKKRSIDHDTDDSIARPVVEPIITVSVLHGFEKQKRLRTDDTPRLTASRINDASLDSPKPAKQDITRQTTSFVPGPSQNPLLSLSHPKYGLPKLLIENFRSLGIHSIYPWQSSCLLGRGLLEGSKNLVYTAPTGGGKSLVADVLMLKRVIEDPAKKAILVLPYVALVQEKLKWLRRVCERVRKNTKIIDQSEYEKTRWRKPHDESVRVVGFFGGSKARAGWSDFDIAVCTIEKVSGSMR